MKIGILTLPLETNYGGILQAFALQRVLCKMGHDVMTIDRHKRKHYESFYFHLAGYVKRLFQHYVMHKNISVLWNPFISEDEYKTISADIRNFVKRNIRMTRPVFSDQLEDIENEYQFDAYVVGSDQVWLEYYCPASFLDFVKRTDVRKIIYAASCGKKSFFTNEIKVEQCKKLARNFVGISVREKALVRQCKNELDIEAQWVLDPTMLLSKCEYIETIGEYNSDEPCVFSYILDPDVEKDRIIKKISNELNLPIVNGNNDSNYVKGGRIPIEQCVFPSVEAWLSNINRASFIITDSFHGTVFSILFNKPFLVIGNEKRGIERFRSLLSLFDLESRFISSKDIDKIQQLMNNKIDYEIVNNVLEAKKYDSIMFLKRCINE